MAAARKHHCLKLLLALDSTMLVCGPYPQGLRCPFDLQLSFGLPSSRMIEGEKRDILCLFKVPCSDTTLLLTFYCQNILLRWTWFQSGNGKHSGVFFQSGCSEIKLRFSNWGGTGEWILIPETNNPLLSFYVHCHLN